MFNEIIGATITFYSSNALLLMCSPVIPPGNHDASQAAGLWCTQGASPCNKSHTHGSTW